MNMLKCHRGPATYEYGHCDGNENIRKCTRERPQLMEKTITRHGNLEGVEMRTYSAALETAYLPRMTD